jgi:putative alpha-1,2-mannosidase
LAPDNNRDNIYISAASLNGQTWDNSYIDFDSIQAGGQIEFQMSEQPNPNWAGDKEHVPYSMSLSN